MLEHIIRFALTQRIFIIIVSATIVAAGAFSWFKLPIDAFPDISPTQVKVLLKAPGMTTTEIESQITRVVENELLGIPNQDILRSMTKYAITDITIDFKQGVDIYWARQQVNERLMNVWDDLPANISGGLAPMSTPLSEMFMFTVDNPNLNLDERRTLLDWHIRPLLRTVSGVAEVNSLGGFVETYEVTPLPTKLASLNISLHDLESAILNQNQNGGLGRINKGNDSIVVRTQGRLTSALDIENVIILNSANQIIRVKDVANVTVGHLTRYGAVSHNGEEAVQGLVIGLKDANAAEVVKNVKLKLTEIESSLPEGTELNIFYDRANLITTAVDTIFNALFQSVILVILVLAAFLGNMRAAIVVSLSLPLSALCTFILMQQFELSANLMSLGGLVIAIGMLVDASVVVVENTVNKLAENTKLPKLHLIFRATKEVAAPTVAGTLIVMIVFTPLLTLTGLEGKLFTPVALIIVFAMASSLLLSLTLIPVISSILLKNQQASEPKFFTAIKSVYEKSIRYALAAPLAAILLSFILLAVSLVAFTQVGKSFMPTLDEGDIIVQLEKTPTINLTSSISLDKQIEQALLEEVPEIVQIVARTGSDELGLDPMGLNETDLFMELKPRNQWRFKTKEALIQNIRDVLQQFPGINLNFTQPIQMRVSEMLTGGTGDVAIKVFGDDIHNLTQVASQIERLVQETQGAKDTQTAMIEGGKFIAIKLKPLVASKFNMTTKELTDFLLPQLEGKYISQIVKADRYTPITMAASTSITPITSVAELKQTQVLMPNNVLVPLSTVAEIEFNEEPVLVERESGKRFVSISTNVEGRDVVGFVNDVQQQIEQRITLPQGYTVSYGGEFESQQRAALNLMLVVPIALIFIFIILFATFRSMALSSLVLANIPFAMMGGIFALFISRQYLSVPASVGFIALLGIAVLNGIVMISYYEQLKTKSIPLQERVISGAARRLRPVLMTATTALFGLLPLIFATGPGAEIQKPLAIVVVGGLISSTLTTLYLLPIFYRKLEERT